MKQHLILLFAAAGLLCSFDTKVPANWLMMKTAEFSVQYPPNWKTDRSGILGTKFILYSPKDSLGLRSYISLSSQPEENDSVGIDSILSINKKELPNSIENFQIISEEILTIHERKTFRLTYTGTQNNREMRWIQQGTMVNKQYNVLTFAATPSNYKKLSGVAKEILNTIQYY